jgi:hypothetical protein
MITKIAPKATCDTWILFQKAGYDMDFGENHLMREIQSQNRNFDSTFGTIFRSKYFQRNKQNFLCLTRQPQN